MATPDAQVHILGTDALGPLGTYGAGPLLLRRLLDRWTECWGTNKYPAVVAIDSLNTLPEFMTKREGLEFLRTGMMRRCWLVVAICESTSNVPEPWEYVADIITRLDTEQERSYQLGSFRILKARAQGHALGANHRWKVYPNPVASAGRTGPSGAPAGRPYSAPPLETGGFYVFPSLHRHLSALGAARTPFARASSGVSFPRSVSGLDALLGAAAQGQTSLPACTALAGPRGLMKSHLAYFTLLSRLKNRVRGLRKPLPPATAPWALIVTFRDNGPACVDTLSAIVEREAIGTRADVAGWMDYGYLDVLDFWPGYIAPEEVAHRILIRLGDETDVCVVDGLDVAPQLLPLCGGFVGFVPHILALLRSPKRSVLWTATGSRPEALADTGLLAMADLIVRFTALDPAAYPSLGVPSDAVQVARVVGERVPAGGISGRGGVLYRDPTSARLTAV